MAGSVRMAWRYYIGRLLGDAGEARFGAAVGEGRVTTHRAVSRVLLIPQHRLLLLGLLPGLPLSFRRNCLPGCPLQ